MTTLELTDEECLDVIQALRNEIKWNRDIIDRYPEDDIMCISSREDLPHLEESYNKIRKFYLEKPYDEA